MGLAGSRHPSQTRDRVYAITDAAASKMRHLVRDCESHGDDTLKHFIDEAVVEARKSEFHVEEAWREKDFAWGIVTNQVVDVTEYLYGVAWSGGSGKIYAIIRKPNPDQDREVVITLITDQEYNDAVTKERWKPLDYDFEAAEELEKAKSVENERPTNALPEKTYTHETSSDERSIEYLLEYVDCGDEHFEHLAKDKVSDRILDLINIRKVNADAFRVWRPVEVEIEVKVAVKIGGET